MSILSERLKTELTELGASLVGFADLRDLPVNQRDGFNYGISTILPHKTVATRAGLGWIGKCALLVTEKYGYAVRISSVLTDAPLEVDKPINQSYCSTCNNCVRNCPAEALSGDLWSVSMERESFYNSSACRNKAIERTC